jgi:hypothetical protein
MDRGFHIQKLVELTSGDWERTSIVAHNRISDVRFLLRTLGGSFSELDNIAVEAESIIGTALGMGDEYMTDEDLHALLPIVQELRNQLHQIPEVMSSST